MKLKKRWRLFSAPVFAPMGSEVRLIPTGHTDGDSTHLPALYYSVRLADGTKVGTCELRLGHHAATELHGNISYTVFPPYRGHGYAASASKQLLRIAAEHGMKSLLITCGEENIASYRTCIALGGEYRGVVPLPDGHSLRRPDRKAVHVFRFSLK